MSKLSYCSERVRCAYAVSSAVVSKLSCPIVPPSKVEYVAAEGALSTFNDEYCGAVYSEDDTAKDVEPGGVPLSLRREYNDAVPLAPLVSTD